MARSPSSVRSVLRKLSNNSGPNFRFSLPLLVQDSLQQHVNDNNTLSRVSRGGREGDLHSSSCHGLPFYFRKEREEEFRSPSSPSGSSSSRSLRSRTDAWCAGNHTSSIWDYRYNNRQASCTMPTLVLHPMMAMSYRGLASAGTGENTNPDGSGDTSQNIKDWAENAYIGAVDSIKATRGAIDEAIPPLQKALEEHPLILEISIPVTIFVGAWAVLPRVLRRLHRYVELGSAKVLKEKLPETDEEFRQQHAVPYEMSVWKAMEDPARLFATLLTLLQVGMLVAPSPIVSQYISHFWSGGSVLCLVWFLQRWKSKTLERVMSYRTFSKDERERYLQFNRFSSWGLILLGALGAAEAAGVAPSSVLAVGGAGGLAAAFAARELIANLLTGVSLSFSKPFTVGDNIKAGAVEGKVQDIGVVTTRLLTPDKNPITVPNSHFTSQAIINKSRAEWRSVSIKIPIQRQEFELMPRISMEIREMLYRNPEVYLEEDKPQCEAQFSATALEIDITCNIKPMSKDAFLQVKQAILVDAARIITSCGAKLEWI